MRACGQVHRDDVASSGLSDRSTCRAPSRSRKHVGWNHTMRDTESEGTSANFFHSPPDAGIRYRAVRVAITMVPSSHQPYR
jgi:hypothetical protein